MCSQVAKSGAHWERGVAGAPLELSEEGSRSLIGRADEALARLAILRHGKAGARSLHELSGEAEDVGEFDVAVLSRCSDEKVIRKDAGVCSFLLHEANPGQREQGFITMEKGQPWGMPIGLWYSLPTPCDSLLRMRCAR